MLNADIAWQFALMLQSGMPVSDIMCYFLPDSSEGERNSIAAGWTRSKLLQEAVNKLNGKEWEKMSMEERIQKSIDKHYSELAYFLWTRNYSQVSGLDKTKADTARSVLETKLAGLAGQRNPLEAFWADLKSGKVNLPNGPLAGSKLGQA